MFHDRVGPTAAANPDAMSLDRWAFDIPAGTVLERFETQDTRHDKHKFFSYFRKTMESPWGSRCNDDDCEFIKVKTTKDLKLIAIPYKTITWDHDVTDEDTELARRLKSLTADACTLEAIDGLIRMESAGCEGSSDWRLVDLLCDAGYDGFVRVVENTEGDNIVDHILQSADDTSAYDEVALCNAGSVTRTVEHFDYRPLRPTKFVDHTSN